MNALTRRDKMFDDFFPEFFRRFSRMPANFDGPAEIRVDVNEDDKGYEVRAEVPGAKKDDIRVSIDGNVVSISTETKEEKESTSGKGAKRTLVRELYYGSSARSFTLPHEVDAKASTAKYESGVLTLLLPRATESTSRTLKIE